MVGIVALSAVSTNTILNHPISLFVCSPPLPSSRMALLWQYKVCMSTQSSRSDPFESQKNSPRTLPAPLWQSRDHFQLPLVTKDLPQPVNQTLADQKPSIYPSIYLGFQLPLVVPDQDSSSASDLLVPTGPSSPLKRVPIPKSPLPQPSPCTEIPLHRTRMNSTGQRCRYKLILIKWSRSMFSQPPPNDAGSHNRQGTDSTMQITTYAPPPNQIPISTPGSIYSPYVTDHSGFQYPMAVYPITKNYAAKEMQGMERNLVTRSDWSPDGFHVVQKAVEEVNEKDRVAATGRRSSSTTNNGYGGGGGSTSTREDPCWEICGFKYESNSDWNQIALVLEKTAEDGERES